MQESGVIQVSLLSGYGGNSGLLEQLLRQRMAVQVQSALLELLTDLRDPLLPHRGRGGHRFHGGADIRRAGGDFYRVDPGAGGPLRGKKALGPNARYPVNGSVVVDSHSVYFPLSCW